MDALHISLEAGSYKAEYVSHIKTSHVQSQGVDGLTSSPNEWSCSHMDDYGHVLQHDYSWAHIHYALTHVRSTGLGYVSWLI